MIERVPSGVPGLDTILRGGFLRGGIFIVQGSPGTGKTILGNQICFSHAARGASALYVTLLAEDHARMLMHIGQLGFFDGRLLLERVYYVSAFRVLEEDGLAGVATLLRREVQARDAGVLIIDGSSVLAETAATIREFKKFIHELQAQAAVTDCTLFLLTGVTSISAEHTLVDGVVELQTQRYGRKAERSLEVHKMRGTGYLRGAHSYRITDGGIVVYPRTEALLAHPSVNDRVSGPAVSTGLSQLDSIMGGGFPHHSTALLLGPPGIGKTTLGLHFLGDAIGIIPAFILGSMRHRRPFWTRPRRCSCPSSN
jgi:circadian clock protein KaiC